MKKLTDEQIDAKLRETTGWVREGTEMARQFQFKDFAEAMRFVNQVGGLAEAANHHPEIFISWNKVKLSLTTHSEGGLTNKDFTLARQINQI